MQDKQLGSLDKLMLLVTQENLVQIKKWGIQDHSAFKWDTIAHEEVGEVSKAILEFCTSAPDKRIELAQHVIEEAIESATLYLKIAEMFASDIELYYA
jgi:hypothetical protein